MNGWMSLFPWRKDTRFDVPQQGHDYFDMYSMPGELLSQLVKRPQEAFFVRTVDLSATGPLYNATLGVGQLELQSAGGAICIYGHDGSATRAVDTTVFMKMWTEQKNQSDPFPLKHNRGFCGPFTKVFLEWPPQINTGVPRYADIIIFKGLFRPWIDGSAAT